MFIVDNGCPRSNILITWLHTGLMYEPPLPAGRAEHTLISRQTIQKQNFQRTHYEHLHFFYPFDFVEFSFFLVIMLVALETNEKSGFYQNPYTSDSAGDKADHIQQSHFCLIYLRN